MTSWWNKNVETRIDDFKSWIGDFNQPSKVYCRNYVADKKYKNLIDCGCGLATDYFGFKTNGYEVGYTGLDSCKYLVELNRADGITMIEAELVETLPISDNSYDVVYCREVLEHLPYYEKTVNEFIRIAAKEVIIVFFIRPLHEYEWKEEIENKIQQQKKSLKEEWEKKERARHVLSAEANLPYVPEEEPVFEVEVNEDNKEINYWKEEDLYHNKYDKKKLEAFIMKNPKVDKLLWVDILDVPYSVDPVKTTEAAEKTPEPVDPPAQPTGEKTILHILMK